MKWFLVLYLFSSDEIFVKEMESKKECLRLKKDFSKNLLNKLKDIEKIECEKGEVMQSINIERDDKDEIL